jgi:hypothetical protein
VSHTGTKQNIGILEAGEYTFIGDTVGLPEFQFRLTGEHVAGALRVVNTRQFYLNQVACCIKAHVGLYHTEFVNTLLQAVVGLIDRTVGRRADDIDGIGIRGIEFDTTGFVAGKNSSERLSPAVLFPCLGKQRDVVALLGFLQLVALSSAFWKAGSLLLPERLFRKSRRST